MLAVLNLQPFSLEMASLIGFESSGGALGPVESSALPTVAKSGRREFERFDILYVLSLNTLHRDPRARGVCQSDFVAGIGVSR